MIACVGYSDNPDTTHAGIEAAREAVVASGHPNRACDVVLLFATAAHDPDLLYTAVRSVVGPRPRVVGGGAVGVMTNRRYGYAGDQVALAAFWLEDVGCDLVVAGGLEGDERAVGARLGQELAGLGVGAETPVLLFYDAIDRLRGSLRLVLGTYLLEGIEAGLGFLPRTLAGAGLQGDYLCSATRQWLGHSLADNHALALAFSGDIRMDHVIMHGCRPATSYYTVTRADRQTILEIDGQPALPFIQGLLGPSIPPEEYAFFLTFGVNRGVKWGEYDEERYASRLCFAVDKQRNGIVMFEPDMQAGTEFQIMHRSLNLEYMRPKLEKVFAGCAGRRLLFSLYIDCAGRAAGYAGEDLEDATVVQAAVAGRVPLLGIYSGVEIAAVADRPRALDWTGVFCLFSRPEENRVR
ncbi:MAG: FIST C-terminal domain-containing protein [Planctomycetes bacterium]|nr:FIST C-terminal domain-containing protein [Planctomycetota bacterium]